MTRTCVVTGAASGIGAATADRLRAAGDEVIGVDLRQADVIADLSMAAGRRQAVAEVLAATERVDVVVACAGVHDETPRTVRVNYFGVVELLDGLREALAEAPAPRVAVTSSIGATHRHLERVTEAMLGADEQRAVALAEEAADQGRGLMLYPTAKHALARWVRRTAVTPEWAGAGIALNAVAPGVVETPMTAEMRGDAELVELLEASVPMPYGGWAPPAAVADALCFLVSPANTHITGQVLFVDGGAEALQRGETAF